MQILIDWEDSILKTHVLAVATIGGIGGKRHMVRCRADEPISSVLNALQEWAESQ